MGKFPSKEEFTAIWIEALEMAGVKIVSGAPETPETPAQIAWATRMRELADRYVARQAKATPNG